MSFLSLTAFLFGVAGVWLTVKKTIWCWPVALVSVMASASEFYLQRLFGDMCLQGIYFIAGIYGWYYWNKRSGQDFLVQDTPRTALWPLFLLTLAQTLIYYLLLLHFKGDRPLFDAFLTAASLSATYMMTMKWKENWIAWAGIDLSYVILYGIKGMGLFALLYLCFAAMAVYGWTRWKSEALKK